MNDGDVATEMISAFKATRPYQTLRHWRGLLDPAYRQNDRKARSEFEQFCRQDGGLGLRADLLPHDIQPKTALLVTIGHRPLARLEGFVLKVLQMAGFETVVLGSRQQDFLRYYRLAQAKAVFGWNDFKPEGDAEWVEQKLECTRSLREWLNLNYQGVHVGRFAIASVMRQLHRGELDFADPDIQGVLRQFLKSSVGYARAGVEILDRVKPDCVVFLDPGYMGQGELFDLTLKRGIDTIRWQGGHKRNLLLFKRYHSGNEREHHASLSAESWRQMCSIPWRPEYGHKVRDELFQCYQSQDWFSAVGTQFGKTIHSQQDTRQKLGLSPGKKIAVIFPHIFWDGSFFSGEDLFEDYTKWFAETIRAACANPRLDWLVKIHPAHVVKGRRDNISGRPQELEVIERAIGSLPPHVKLIYPDTDLSTYSLFEIADYAVTVRGTVGIESALFGIPVVTAGTGRYDRRGFTLDSTTRQEYLQKLATLETQPRLTVEQVELAERYAYAVLICRPVTLSSISLEYERDHVATQKVIVNCQTRGQWLAAPDMQQLAAWIADGEAEDMLTSPPTSTREILAGAHHFD